MLYVLRRRDARSAGAVDYNTNVVFVVWFFLCIAGTVAGSINIGNVAHGSGPAVGVLARPGRLGPQGGHGRRGNERRRSTGRILIDGGGSGGRSTRDV